MRASDFTAEAPGRLVYNADQGGYYAFVPNPLPPELNVDLGMVKKIAVAHQALGKLAGLGQELPNPHLLINPFLRREAVLSSRIEGTIASAQELVLFELSPEEKRARPDVREVANYVKALEHGLSRLKELPVCLRLIRETHAKLMEGVRGKEKRPGEFRTTQNFIGNPGQKVQEARFVPPPAAELSQALDEFERYLHGADELPSLVRLALVHYQFEAIHPFGDGNGRIGRLMLPLLLCSQGDLPTPLLYLSGFFDQHRDAYQDLLLRVSQTGDWLSWINFFLDAAIEQAKDATARSMRLLLLWEAYRARMQKAQASALALRLIDELFAYPAITISRAAKRLGVTYPSAKSHIQRLVAEGILVEHEPRKWNKTFIAPEVIAIIEAEQG